MGRIPNHYNKNIFSENGIIILFTQTLPIFLEVNSFLFKFSKQKLKRPNQLYMKLKLKEKFVLKVLLF